MTDALVVGGGLAGSAVATRLARAGHSVVVLERDAGPSDKVCGEFLSHEASAYVRALGIDLEALGAVPIDSVSYHGPHTHVVRPLPFAALSLSRRVLDEAMREHAARAGATVIRGSRVTDVATDGRRGYRVRLADGSTRAADALLLATGKHDLRSHKREAGLHPGLVAFKVHFELPEDQRLALERRVELVPFDGGYAGLQPIERGLANLCLLVSRRRLADVGGQWDPLLASLLEECPQLARRLSNARPCTKKPCALSSIPYGYIRSESDGIWYLGDQAAVIPSFAGDGMAIALHSAEAAARALLSGSCANTYQRELARDVRTQVWLATALSHALVRRQVQPAIGAAMRMWPGLLRKVALATRIPTRALDRNLASVTP